MMQVGDTLPHRVITISTSDMVAYAGATWDHHKLHHDTQYLASKGIEAPVVDGQVFGAYFATQALTAFPAGHWIQSMSFRFRSMVFANDTVEIVGVVSVVDSGITTIEHTAMVGDRLCVTGLTRVGDPRE